MLKKLWHDEFGVILSAEIVLVGTILVLGMIVGLVELQCAVVFELNDLSDAIGNLDQSYQTSGLSSHTDNCRIKAATHGSHFHDKPDECDFSPILVCDPSNSKGEK